MALHPRYFAGLFLAALCSCNQAGNVQQAINSEEANVQDARDDARVRSGRLEELADELNAQGAATGGTRGRALEAEARQDSNAALSVYEAGETKAEAIERNIGAQLNGMADR